MCTAIALNSNPRNINLASLWDFLKWDRILSLRFLVYVTRGQSWVIHAELMHSQHDRFNVVIAILFRVQRLQRWFACLIVREIKSATDVADTNCDCFAFRSFSCSLNIVISIRDTRVGKLGNLWGTEVFISLFKTVTALHKFKWALKKEKNWERRGIERYLFILRSFVIHGRSNILNRRDQACKHLLSGIVQYSYRLIYRRLSLLIRGRNDAIIFTSKQF